MTTLPAGLREQISGLMLADRRRLGRQADQAESLSDGGQRQRAVIRLKERVGAAEARIAARRSAVPELTYPGELPVSQRRAEIAAAIAGHQVVIVAGETGSGKTTQLPKICLELGRGVAGQIGHTQPRRIAARSVAQRIADELGTGLGAAVGYKVRFTDTSSENTLVKLMTDGILLTELHSDRDLLRYDTLIIDEAHERSLNIDFLLGYVRRLLPRRPDLKVIITSATIDPGRFAAHFGEAPVIEVSGRTYPVEVRYRPLADPEDPEAEPRDQVQGIIDAVGELRATGTGDILVFLSGEREIRDTADALTGADAAAAAAGLEVLPLYGRLSAAEQHRVFEPHASRRVVLATNVAETSLTVPGIEFVIDPGTARISRYSQRTKVQRLPIEPVSQASANQRAGRCGRTADGVCIRLYSAADYASRPEFTEPEILRTSLASVILRMADLGLGEVADFPFLDPPDPRQVIDGVRLLEELGAVGSGEGGGRGRGHGGGRGGAGRTRLTATGHQLARLPVDPRLARMIIEAGRRDCAREVLVIAAALAIQDPRERPAEAREAADASHARFAEPGSDFLALVTLWDYLRDRQRELSSSAFRRLCRREYLHYLRVREWQDVHAQLRQAARDLGVATGGPDGDELALPAALTGVPPSPSPSSPSNPSSRGNTSRTSASKGNSGTVDTGRFPPDLYERVHRALLSGLLSHIGMQDTSAAAKEPPQRGRRRPLTEFAGARGARFAIFPDSPLARKPPAWVVAAELVETSRLWARTVASIEPEWAEENAGHLIRRSYGEPRWDPKRTAAMVSERVMLYGLPIVAARPVLLGRVDPAAARDMFITHALVEGDWQTHHAFFAENQQLIADAAELERKARRRGLVADDRALFAFYDQRIPAGVTSARHFDQWWKQERRDNPGLLTLSPADLAGPDADQVDPAEYPESWAGLPVSYEFEPGAPDDGVTVDIPLASLNQVDGEEFGWQVPGLREELITELIRSLPKALRVRFVPAPETARKVLPELGQAHGDLLDALSAALRRMTGVTVPRDAWDPGKLPAHLRVSFRVTDGSKVLAAGKDLAGVRAQVAPRLRAVLTDAARDLTRTGLTSWDFDTLPRQFSAGQVRGYPALADTGDGAGGTVDIVLCDTPEQAAASMLRGTRRLILRQVPSGARAVALRLPASAKLAMGRQPYPSVPALLDDCAAAAADQIIAAAGGPAWDRAGFEALLAEARARLAAVTADVVSAVARVLGAAHEVETGLAGVTSPVLAAAAADLREQLAGLIFPGFVSETGAARLADLTRYLQAMRRRLDKMADSPGRDAGLMATVHEVTGEYEDTLAALSPGRRASEQARAVRWMIEELRVSLFAQALGTRGPISEKRIRRALEDLAG
ncbi:MAG TPA: ATP-dependent RNA helicase HrpA [Streptosporangiaceae bacterium]